MSFRNSILAGLTLIREAIRSQNYDPGVAGWSIDANGSAEFNNIVIRGGTVVSGTGLYYDPSPGPGTMIMSIAAEAGTDQYGNAYERGVTWYEAGVPVVQLGDDLPGVFGMSGVTAYDRDQNRFVALTNGSIAFLPIEGPVGQSAGIGLIRYEEYDPIVMRMRLVSGRSVSGQRYALMNMDSATTGAKAEIAMASDNVIPDDFRFSVYGETHLKQAITQYASDTFETYTPTVGGAGSATWSTRTGWYQRIGKMIYVCAYLVASGGGSGGALLTVDMPTAVYRGTRQTIPLQTDVTGPNGSHAGTGSAVFFQGGSGATPDRLRTDSNDGTNRPANLTGADVLAGSIITIEGWYREA